MSERHRTERVLPFTDAVVAIAMTLLVLPLIELVPGLPAEGLRSLTGPGGLERTLGDAVPQLIGFVISFFVIARLWWAHHSIFEGVETWTTGLVVANVFWLFTIVLLPFVTGFSTVFEPNWLTVLVYVGTMTASSALQTVMARLVMRAGATRDLGTAERYYGNLTTTITFAVALVVCLLVPQAFYSPLVLLAVTGVVDRRVHRRLVAAGFRPAATATART